MRVHSDAVNFFHFQVDIGVNLVVIKDATSFQEVTVAVEGLKGFAQAAADLWDVLASSAESSYRS